MPPHLEILPFLHLTEEINPSWSAEPEMFFFEGNARQGNTDIPHGPPIVASRPKPNIQQCRLLDGVVHEEVFYITKGLNDFVN